MSKKTILFVCEGNSIRSIIAEAEFNNICNKDFIAKSAGTLPAHQIDPKTKEVLKEVHIPLKKQNPSYLDFEDIESAYRLVLMSGHIHNFPVLAPEEKIIRWDISDPVGMSINTFRKSRDRIILNVKRLVDSLE